MVITSIFSMQPWAMAERYLINILFNIKLFNHWFTLFKGTVPPEEIGLKMNKN